MARRRRGFTLIELLVVISIIALLIGILLPALGTARKRAWITISLSNLRQQGVIMNSYGADFDNLIPTFQAKPGIIPQHSKQNRDLALQIAALPNNFDSVLRAAAIQQMMIFRDLHPRQDWPDGPIDRHTPFILYSHIVTQAYADEGLPNEAVISPADRVRGAWQEDIDEFLDSYLSGSGGYPIEPPQDATNAPYRWAFSSSFTIVPSALSGDIGKPVGGQGPNRVIEKASSNGYFGAGSRGRLAERRFDEVRSPGSKVVYYENYDRYTDKATIYMGFENATVPTLNFDGSAAFRDVKDSNLGWRPNNPLFENPTYRFTRDPVFDTSGTPSQAGLQYRFDQTAWGLQGVDFGGERLEDRDRAEAFMNN